MEDDRIVISSGVELTPESVASRTFATGFRGYDQGEVRAFLKRVADELSMHAARENDLRQSLQEALSRAAHPDLDEETLTVALGEHAARLLTNAREAATNIVSEAETRAARIIGEAETKIARVRAEADSLLARRAEEAERLTTGLRQGVEADVRALRERARAEAEAEIESARVQGREMVGEARALRERMLADLTRRRRTAEVHIEQLRLARQRLLEAYGVVRRTLDEATTELAAADAEVRPPLAAASSPPSGDVDDSPPPADSPNPPDPAPPSRALAAVPAPADVAGPVVRELARTTGAGPRSGPGGNGTLSAGSGAGVGERPTPSDARPTTVPPAPAPTSPAEGSPSASKPLPEAHSGAATPAPPPNAPASGPIIESFVSGTAGSAPTPGSDSPASGRATDVPAASAPAPTADAPAAPPSGKEGRSPKARVDELFARMRAAQPTPGGPEEESDGTPGASASAAAAAGAEGSAGNGHGRPAGHDLVGDGAAATADEVTDESGLFRRDELVEPIEADLIRQLKRTLQDEQNEVLDRLRRQRRPTPEAVLPDLVSQTERYHTVAHPVLAEAARRGAQFVAGPDGKEPSLSIVERWAVDLAVDLVIPLRERLERALLDAGEGRQADDADDGDDDADGGTVAERLSASYRQWKTQQIEPAARHHAVAAFCRGAYAATPEGAHLRWVVDDDGPCPDCDDNVLAGALAKGQAFPTGQAHPPAHVGCRCLLIPADPS